MGVGVSVGVRVGTGTLVFVAVGTPRVGEAISVVDSGESVVPGVHAPSIAARIETTNIKLRCLI